MQATVIFYDDVFTNSTDGANADTLLGALDSSFLFAYAIGMYFM